MSNSEIGKLLETFRLHRSSILEAERKRVHENHHSMVTYLSGLEKKAMEITDWQSWGNDYGLPECLVCGATRYASGYRSIATDKWLCGRCFNLIEKLREMKRKREQLVCDGRYIHEGIAYHLKIGETYQPRPRNTEGTLPATVTGFQPSPDGEYCMVVFDRGFSGFESFLRDHIVSPSTEECSEDE